MFFSSNYYIYYFVYLNKFLFIWNSKNKKARDKIFYSDTHSSPIGRYPRKAHVTYYVAFG